MHRQGTEGAGGLEWDSPPPPTQTKNTTEKKKLAPPPLYLVKPVYRPQVPVAPVPTQDVHQGVEPIIAAGVDRPGGGLVHHQHLLVLVYNPHRLVKNRALVHVN